MNRSLEIAITVFLLLVLLPAFIVAVFCVLFFLGKPVLFSQIRSGRDGCRIRVDKLRTMHPHPADVPALEDAERTPAAMALLRRLRLDEIPQLVSVLRGELALVGPRPLLPETVEGLGADGRLRGAVRPGITGWAQVSGNTRLSVEEKLRLDLWYVANRSTALDLRILRETILVPLLGERRRPDRLAAALIVPRPAGRTAP